jgi:hypothetical protein
MQFVVKIDLFSSNCTIDYKSEYIVFWEIRTESSTTFTLILLATI